MDPALLATLRIHNPWLDRLDTVEEGVPVRFVRPWEIDLVLGELER